MKKSLLLAASALLLSLSVFSQSSNYVLPYRTQTRMIQILQVPQVTGVDSVLVRNSLGWVGTSPFPNWDRLSGKPTSFPSSIAQVSGLAAALDLKADVSSLSNYLRSTWRPSVADVTGLQSQLDSKQPAGDYLTSSYVPTWASITGKPSTFTPSAHTHVIADVTGLQASLDSKITTGSSIPYSTLTGAPTIPTNTNQLTNGSGFLTGITSAQVTTALGYTPYNGATNPNGYITLGQVPAALISSVNGKTLSLIHI